MKRLTIGLSSLALGACALLGPHETPRHGTPREAAPPETPPPEVLAAAGPAAAADQAVPDVFAAATQQSATRRLSNATALADQTRKIIPGWSEADPELAQSRAAIGQSDWPRGAMHADEAEAMTDAALSDHYARLAQAELAKAYGYTGLTDTQLAQLHYAEEAMVSGNARLAYGRLRMLEGQLEGRTRTYTVSSGDSLWIIAARPDVYANPNLWPLIWQANVAVIPNPNRLVKGLVLKLPQHPTVEDVARAVDIAKGKKAKTTQIGEVREAVPHP